MSPITPPAGAPFPVRPGPASRGLRPRETAREHQAARDQWPGRDEVARFAEEADRRVLDALAHADIERPGRLTPGADPQADRNLLFSRALGSRHASSAVIHVLTCESSKDGCAESAPHASVRQILVSISRRDGWAALFPL